MDLSGKSKSILREISTFVPVKNKEDLIESRADHIIASAIHIIEMIDECYTDAEAEQLKRRFLSSIRGKDPDRFNRAIRKIKHN